MSTAESSPPQISLRRLLLLITLWCVFLAVCAFGVRTDSTGSVWWGPVHWIRDGSAENRLFGWLMLLGCPGLASPLVLRPTLGTMLAAGCAIAAWLILGILGWGINV